MYNVLAAVAIYLVIGLLMGELYDRGCKLGGKKPTAAGWLLAFALWPLGIYFMAKRR